MPSETFTTYLKSTYSESLRAATEHSFLVEAGRGTVSEEKLCSWLVQDKYYQFAYITFVGRLLAKINLGGSSISPLAAAVSEATGPTDNLQVHALDVLVGFINAVRQELSFYDETISKYELRLVPKETNAVTQEYMKLFEEASAEGRPLFQGLVVLWATEFVYLRAWQHARRQKSVKDVQASDKGPAPALRYAFIPNWTSEGFEAAVQDLGELINDWQGKASEADSGSDDFFKRVLSLETQFWPQP